MTEEALGVEAAGYLGRIDWGLALVVAIVAIVVGLAVNRFLQGTFDEVLAAIPALDRAIAGSLLRRRRGIPTEPWICPACRSLNTAVATRCYRGCGAREELEPPGGPAGPGPVDLGPGGPEAPTGTVPPAGERRGPAAG